MSFEAETDESKNKRFLGEHDPSISICFAEFSLLNGRSFGAVSIDAEATYRITNDSPVYVSSRRHAPFEFLLLLLYVLSLVATTQRVLMQQQTNRILNGSLAWALPQHDPFEHVYRDCAGGCESDRIRVSVNKV